MIKRAYITAFLLSMFLSLDSMIVLAQSGGFAGSFSRIGFSASGIGRANSMTAVTSEGAQSYYNPALTSLRSNGIPVQFTVAAMQFDRVFQSTSVQFRLPPTAAFSVQIIRAGINDIDGRTLSGYPTGNFNANEFQVNSSFGIEISSRFRAGVGIKFNLANYNAELDNATAVGLDLGALIKLTDEINLGLSIQDLFATYTWNSADLYGLDQSRNVNNSFPTRFIFGLAYQKEAFDVSADFEVQSLLSESILTETDIINGIPTTFEEIIENNTSLTLLRLGGAWRAHERFTLRGGWRLADLTESDSWALSTGFSIHLPFDTFSPSIDYAFAMEPYRISRIHLFTLKLNL